MTNSATHTKAALYLRLSRDDDLAGDSSSIMTQRQILQKYAKENNFFVVDEYVDDGYSGTNFNRPGFQRMISDIDTGKVNWVSFGAKKRQRKHGAFTAIKSPQRQRPRKHGHL